MELRPGVPLKVAKEAQGVFMADVPNHFNPIGKVMAGETI
jgi:hypothetical protein